jgi:hypothetical protein
MPSTKRKTGKASERKTPYDKSGAGSKDRVKPLVKPTKSTKRKTGKAVKRNSK